MTTNLAMKLFANTMGGPGPNENACGTCGSPASAVGPVPIQRQSTETDKNTHPHLPFSNLFSKKNQEEEEEDDS